MDQLDSSLVSECCIIVQSSSYFKICALSHDHIIDRGAHWLQFLYGYHVFVRTSYLVACSLIAWPMARLLFHSPE